MTFTITCTILIILTWIHFISMGAQDLSQWEISHIDGLEQERHNSIAKKKWPPFYRQYIQMQFREWNILYFDWNSNEIFPKGPIDYNLALV